MDYADEEIIQILKAQDGVWTVIEMKDGKRYRALDIAWGYDIGDEWAHITTNISPGREGAVIDFFYTSEISTLIDENSNNVLFQAKLS